MVELCFEIISGCMIGVMLIMLCYVMFLKFVMKYGTKIAVKIVMTSNGDAITEFNECDHENRKRVLVYTYETNEDHLFGYSKTYFQNADDYVGKTCTVYVRERDVNKLYLDLDIDHKMSLIYDWYLRSICIWLCCLIVFLVYILWLHYHMMLL